MSSRKIPWRWLAAALAAFLIAGAAAPFLSADQFGERIREALEASLGRRVTIGKVRFDLFQGPGFTISDVEIGEHPAFGIEPFVTWSGGAASLDARLKLQSLWTGKLEWASLRLNQPIVNLVKVDDRWNFEPLLTPKLVAALPRIEVREGRINFKFGDTKSIFYIANVDLDAAAHVEHGADWDLQFSGEPARTDRPSPENGYRQSLTGAGHWKPDGVRFDVQLEKSALSEMSALIFGRDVGVHGTIGSRIQLTGPVNNIQIAGALQIQDLHRWDQMPMHGDGWPLEFRGRLDLTTQRLEMESQAGALPVAIRYRVADYLSRPHWALGLSWNRFPTEPLVAIARHMGAPLPEGVKLSGTLDGAVSWSNPGLQGQVAFHDAAVAFPDSPPLEFGEAKVLFDGDRIHLQPASVKTDESKASLEADYRLGTQELDLSISSDSMSIAAVRTHAARLPAPLLEALSVGVWKGSLRYRRGPDIEEGWSGQVQLNKAEIPLPGLAEPLRVRSAVARFEGARLSVDKIVARVGNADLAGDYRYEPGAARPHRFRLTVPSIDAAALERLLQPTLRRNQSFFARTLGIGKPEAPPAWLASRFMDGTIQIGKLTIGDTELEQVHSRLRWSGTRVDLLDVEARVENGSARGNLSVNLAGEEPAYRLRFQVDSVDYQGGKVDADGVLETAGSGAGLLSRLHAQGSFSGRALDAFKTASGCYRLTWPRLQLSELQLTVGQDLYIGHGAMQDDGRLLLQLSSGGKQMRVTGTLAQLVVE